MCAFKMTTASSFSDSVMDYKNLEVDYTNDLLNTALEQMKETIKDIIKQHSSDSVLGRVTKKFYLEKMTMINSNSTLMSTLSRMSNVYRDNYKTFHNDETKAFENLIAESMLVMFAVGLGWIDRKTFEFNKTIDTVMRMFVVEYFAYFVYDNTPFTGLTAAASLKWIIDVGNSDRIFTDSFKKEGLYFDVIYKKKVDCLTQVSDARIHPGELFASLLCLKTELMDDIMEGPEVYEMIVKDSANYRSVRNIESKKEFMMHNNMTEDSDD